jgi:arylsulfatase A-like enzyme
MKTPLKIARRIRPMGYSIVTSLLLVSASLASAGEKMNVVFILADDLGWADTTLYGHTKLYKTPNIERLAKRGMTFNRAYANSPLCSPTRASLLTGQTPARHGSTAPQHHTKDVRLKASVAPEAPTRKKELGCSSVTRLDTKLPTLVKQLKAANYQTAHFGKWHLGPEPYSPLQHGFDVDIPHWAGPGPAGSFVAPWRFPEFKHNKPKEHIEDRMAEEAVKWLGSLKGKQPFFMNYWQFSVHAPFHAKQNLIDKYRKVIDPKDAQRSPTYAAMVHSLDDAVGTLLHAVDKAGIAEKTIIVFYSDNGGNKYSEVDSNRPTSNRPLRGGKATMYEGGIRVPCIIAWPGVTQPGSRSDEVIQTSDFYPTLLNQLGVSYPEDHPVDGIDITPALGGGKLDRKAIFTYFPHGVPVPDWLPPSVSVHYENWKLIRLFHQGENGAHGYRLYDLSKDIGETTDLTASNPEMVSKLDKLIEDYLTDSNAVVPKPNPRFDPTKYAPEKVGVGAKKFSLRAPPATPAVGV